MSMSCQTALALAGWLTGRFHRWVARSVLALMLGALSAAALAQVSPLMRQEAWVEDGTGATVDAVAARRGQGFVPADEQTIHPLGPQRTLWLRLLLQPAGPEAADWGLDIPVPLLDEVTLYQRGPDGRWQAQRAGDALPVAQWKRPGRYPNFDVTLPPGPVREVYLQVRHSDPIGFPLRLAPAAVLEQGRQVDYLLLGIVLGTLMLLAVSCLIQGVIHRDLTYDGYAFYALAMTLTTATVTGMGGHLLWNQSPRWADAAQGVLPVLLAGINVLFLRHLCGISVRYPRVGRVALATGGLILLMGAVFAWLPGGVQNGVIAFSFVASPVFGFVMAALAWRRHDVVGAWVFLAYIPLAFTVVVAVLRLYGWLPAGWLSLDGTAVASAMVVPLLLLALNARTRDRHGAQARVNKLTEQDALTGLLSLAAFERQLKAAVSGALMRREASAVVVVAVANLQQIREFYGDAMAEQCLLRAVIKLNRVLRDGDPAGRIDTGRFAVIYEGARSRDEIQERMVRLVASGLVPPRGARLEVPLQFHVVCAMLGEHVLAPRLLLRRLGQTLDGMTPRTRRPVRFLEPGDDGGAGAGSQGNAGEEAPAA